MKSEKALNLLKCTRQTLAKHIKQGKIQIIKLDNEYYDYCDEDIYKILSNNERHNCFYTKFHGTIDNLKCYDNYYKMLDDLLQYKIKHLTVYGYEIVDIDTLHYLCNKYGCYLEII